MDPDFNRSDDFFEIYLKCAENTCDLALEVDYIIHR